MVDESLKSYLQKALRNACPDVAEEDAIEGLAILFAYTEKEHAFNNNETNALIAAIDKCKILDPACGSGAFPMGILHKLEFVLGKLDHDNVKWRDRQIGRVEDLISHAERSIEDVSVLDNTVKALEAQILDIKEAFARNDLGYGRKLYLIENAIYGVDIQSIATQVSKLRFFISLIVEQRIDVGKDNFGIRPLPNLEIKFTTADTLIGIEKPANQGDLFDSAIAKNLERELQQIRHNLFNAKTPKTKQKYRQRDQELREQIALELNAHGWSEASAHQLSQWDPYDQNASSPFFDVEWMYGINDGFDIVIGNPPYRQIQKFNKDQKDSWVQQDYQTYAATADIYCLFYERGAQLLREGGHLCYITSNKWMRAGYGEKLRAFLSSAVNTTTVLDFGMAQNFGAATTYTNILNYENKPSRHETLSCYAADDKAAMAGPGPYFQENAVSMPDLDERSWVVVTPDRYRIKQAVEAQGVPLEDWDLTINYGIKTGFNDAFYLNEDEKVELIAKEPQAKEIIVPLLRGRYVQRYGHSWDGTWMISTFPSHHLNIKDFPEVKKRLEKYQERLEPKPRGHSGTWNGRKAGSYKWFETQDAIAYHEEFHKPKIIYPNMTKYLPFYFDVSDQFFVNDKAFIISSHSESLPYLTAILNSTLFRCCFRDNFPELMGNTYEVRKVFVDKIPIKKPTKKEAKFFESLVAMVQLTKRESIEVPAAFLEEVIDACVLELYFPEEASSKKLQFMEQVTTLLDSGNHDSVAAIETFYAKANDSKHPIRNQLLRLTADSPGLFAVIKQAGAV